MTCQSVDLFSFILLVDGSEYILCLISSGNWSAFVSSDAAFPCSLSSLLELQLGEVPLQRSSTGAEFAPRGTFGTVLRRFRLSHLVGPGVLLASCGWRPWGLQGTLQSTERPLQEEFSSPKCPRCQDWEILGWSFSFCLLSLGTSFMFSVVLTLRSG